MGKGPTGKDWVQAQAEAQRAKRAQVPPSKTILVEESKLKLMGTKMGELIKSVMVLNERLRKVAGWNALHVARIVELRAELRAQWERSTELEGQVLELSLALGQSMGGGYALKASYERDGEWVTDWAVIKSDEPVLNLAALDEMAGEAIVPARFTLNTDGAQLAIVATANADPELQAAVADERIAAAQERLDTARAATDDPSIAALRAVLDHQRINRAEAEFGHLADDSGVVHTPDPAVGVNQPPQPSTGLGAEEDDN